MPHDVNKNNLQYLNFDISHLGTKNTVDPSIDFRLTENIPLDVLKSISDNLLCYSDNKRVVKIEYCSPLIDNK